MNERLIAAVARLADVLARENAALGALDLRSAACLLAEKQDAADMFSKAQAETPTVQDARVAETAEHLHALASENRALLEHAIAVQTRVIGIVARASRPVAVAPRYGATGRMTDGPVLPCALSARA